MRIFLFIVGMLLCSSGTFGWNEHNQITEAVLKDLLEIQEDVAFVPLDEALQSGISTLRARTTKDFLTELKINKKYVFPQKLSEAKGKRYAAADILSKYSDEPDWGMDQYLFEPDQYPELWREDTQYVAQKAGVKSQGFRHMYFPGKFIASQPFSSFQIPFHPVGEAPERAHLFWKLAVDFFQHKEFYWGYRILAWSIHFMEDLHQPFHARQLPHISFLQLKWNSFLPGLDIPATGDQIGHYHFSYEQWIARKTLEKTGALYQSLQKQAVSKSWSEDVASLIKSEVVPFSGNFAGQIGKLAKQIFPKMDPAKKSEDYVGTPEWWSTVQEKPEMAELTATTAEVFTHLSETVRRSVLEAKKRSN